MKGQSDQLLKIFGVSVILMVVGFAADVISISDLLLFGGLMTVIGLTWKVTQTDLMKKQINRMNNGNGASGINYNFQEGKEIIKDFARQEFKGRINKKKGVSIDHTRSESEPASIILDPSEGDVIQVRHYYITHGDLNQPMDFFVDVTNGKYFAHKQVNERRRSAGDRNPFMKLDAYRKTRRYARKVRPEEEDGTGMQRVQGIPVGTFPVNQENNRDDGG